MTQGIYLNILRIINVLSSLKIVTTVHQLYISKKFKAKIISLQQKIFQMLKYLPKLTWIQTSSHVPFSHLFQWTRMHLYACFLFIKPFLSVPLPSVALKLSQSSNKIKGYLERNCILCKSGDTFSKGI